MIKEKIVWTPKYLFSGKYSEFMWKKLKKAKTKKELREVLFVICAEMQGVENRLVELEVYLSKHVNSRYL